MADLVFYTNPMSRGRIVRWMLEEVGEPYETQLLTYGSTMKAPPYLSINPMGKVPAIRHDGTTVTEAAAICAYLADAFPEKGLAPPLGSPARGPYFRWLFFAAGPVEAAIANKSLGVEVPSDKRATVGYGSFDDVVAALEQAVSGGPYICGDTFTAADVYVGSQIGWGLMFGTMPKREAFVEYAGRLQSREAAVRARQIDDDLIAQQKQETSRREKA